MDIQRIFTISESEHRIHNPFTREYFGWGVFALMAR